MELFTFPNLLNGRCLQTYRTALKAAGW
ncbi:uncharacterized protein METZ01_LOCUS128098 [marine metagenome]|uniref:Uncharacterized protein n=1 Tax=marine metagenome TaxID=408172 RepID=A0A381YE22_9ZZZZ